MNEVVHTMELYGYSILFFGGFIAGMTGIFFMYRIPEPRMSSILEKFRLFHLLTQPFKDDNFRKLMVFMASWNFAVNLAAPEKVKAHPAAEGFPGAVPADAKRITREVAIVTDRHGWHNNGIYGNPGSPYWHSTGLYAAPGEVITVPKDLPVN